MRYVCVCAIAAACGGKPAPAPRSPAPKPKPAAGPVVYDDAVFVSGKTREHLVITKAADGWTFDTEVVTTTDAGTSTARIVITTDLHGAFVRATDDVVSRNGDERHDTLTRHGDDLEVVEAGGPKTIEAGDILVAAYVEQRAYLCIDPTPRSIVTTGGYPDTVLGAAEAVGDVTRAPLASNDGDRELYCRDGRVLALDGDRLFVREGGEEAFEAARMPAPAPPPLPDGATEEDRTLTMKATADFPDATLHCAFVAPASTGARVPGVAFVTFTTGSDRDGNAFDADDRAKRYTLRRLAYALAARGLASMRCGAPDIGGDTPIDTVSSATEQGVVALDALATEKIVDPARLGYFALQDHASVAPEVWKAHPVKALVLFDPSDVDWEDTVLASLALHEEDDHIDPSDATSQLPAARRAFEAIRAGDPLPDDAPPVVKDKYDRATAWVKSFTTFEPLDAAAAVERTAVLLLQPGFHTADVAWHPDLHALERAYGAAKGKKKNAVFTKIYDDVTWSWRVGGYPYRPPPWWAPISQPLLDDIVGFFAQRLAS